MKSNEIAPGAVVKITANNSEHIMEIVNIRDGKVTFRHPKGRRNNNALGLWWLPYEYVKENGRTVKAEQL